ncbi:MAG: methyltransferase domain-containing protein [Lentimicrobium sp.]|nr:methyltransferase domain-containing protein [Lentimicrobium sp.]
MLQYIRSTATIENPDTFSFEVSTSSKYRSALYRQVLANAGLEPGQVFLELDVHPDIKGSIMAKVNLVQSDLMGGFPGLLELSSNETMAGIANTSNSLPWSEGAFDTIICIGIFNHVSDHASLFAEINRLLSPNGKLIIADQWFRKAGPMFANLLQGYKNENDFRIYSPVWVTRLLRKGGFNLIETLPAGATNFFCIATALK